MFYFITIENNPDNFEKITNYARSLFSERTFIKNSFNKIFNIALIDSNKNLNIKDFVIEHNNTIYFIYSKIFNKNDLKEKLNITEIKTLNDNLLFFKYFTQKGVNGLKDIIGKWVIIIYNLKSSELQLARDHTGWRNIYYSKINDSFILTNHFASLSNINKSDKNINFYNLASICVGDYGNPFETCYKNINKIPPATYVIVKDNTIQTNVYWNINNLPEIKYSDNNSYIRHFLNLFNEVIKEQIPSDEPVVTTLSSGYDSSFVSSFLANYFLNKRQQIYAITSVPLFNIDNVYNNRLTNEYELARFISDKYKNIIHLVEKSENINPIEGIILSLKIHGYPLRNSSNQYWILSIFEKLLDLKIFNLIWAQNGNITISWPFGSCLLTKNTTKKFIKEKLVSLKLLEPQYLINSYFNTDFIKHYKLKKYFLESKYKPNYISINTKKTRIHFFNFLQKIGYSYLEEKTNFYNIENYDPTSDPRIIEFCFSIPQKLYLKRKETKIFYKLISENIVPYEIINNKYKGKQAADLPLRIEKLKTEIEEILKDSFNYPAVQEMFNLQQLIFDFTNNKITNYEKFLRILNIIFFLKIETFYK